MDEETVKTIRSGFKKGNIDLMILSLLSMREMYGYEIVRTLDEMTDGVFQIPEGSVYPILYKFVEKGFLKEDRRPSGIRRLRSYYIILPAGREHLKVMVDAYYLVHRKIEQILNYGRGGCSVEE